MSDIVKSDMEKACAALTSMIERSEKAQQKFSPGTSQYTLQKNRIQALKIAAWLIKAEMTGDKTSNTWRKEDLEKAVAPINSLISKSEKAMGKLDKDSWQYKMLRDNVNALHIAWPLLTARVNDSC